MKALFREELAECIRTSPAGTSEQRKEPLKTVQEALFQLSASDKALILFRDQCHLPFETIGAILSSGGQESRLSCLAARERLRNALKEILEKHSGASHGL